MLTYVIIDYNRPFESELCLKSIHKYSKFDYKIVYLSNGGEQDYAINFYKNSLIDKLILRKKNSGCGLAMREAFNDFDLESDYIALIQCDQFLIREYSKEELDYHISLLESKRHLYIDLAGNQGNGNPSERAHLINKYEYRKIPNTIGGPGPYANEVWTEKSFQDYIKNNNLSFFTCPLLFADNGKISRREYPCGGELIQYTDEKSVFITKPIKNRVDFPNLHLTDKEWSDIIQNKWINGTVPEMHKKDSFLYWREPYTTKNTNV
jgi:hypothetical protein